jgi:SHS family lactate transporter-like MFS transporter
MATNSEPKAGSAAIAPDVTAPPRIQDVTATQWHAFFGAFLGWAMDGFDFSILTFLLIDIQRSFTVDRALAGALGTVTLMFRLIGGVTGGTAADRYGRKIPLMLSIMWISLFSLLTGFSSSYSMLFAFRALFGIGMGGVWAAALPLALEHWPTKLRGLVSGMLMSGFNWGYIAAALVFQFVYPLFSGSTYQGWRVLFWVAASPVLLIFWIRARVQESPVWLERRGHLEKANQKQGLSVVGIFRRPLIWTTLQTSLMMACFILSYYSTTFWYPTFLRESHFAPFPYLLLLNLGGVAGTILWGRASESSLGRRGAISLAAFIGILLIPIYVGTHSPGTLMFGAFMIGACGIGIMGVAPAYLSERFPTSARGVGPGFAFHAGAAVGSLAPTLIGFLQDRGIPLPTAMRTCMAITAILVIVVMRLGPETRGKTFATHD